jgi:resuscitation-promoting factor RpfA
MMTTTSTLYARTGAAAIAAALALSSTPLIAQEAPASTQPVPILTPPPPTTSNSTPAATTTDTVTTPDTSTTDTTVASTARTRRTVTRARATAAAPPAQAVHRSITRQTAHVAATGAPAAAVAKAARPVAAAPASPPTVQANPTPTPAQTTTSVPSNETALEFGAGVLALIVLGGLAWAVSRRRHRDEFVEDRYGPAYEPAPEAQAAEPLNEPTIEQEQPAIVAPSAFAWGNEQDTANASEDGSDRRAGESWVERAYRGPSPANPSASLRNRLKRAAFFDKREREVAAGEAKAVDTDAGLPEATEEREFA